MYLSREAIIKFLDAAEWATPQSFVILKNGAYTNKGIMPIRTGLPKLCSLGKIKRLNHIGAEAIYASLESTRTDIGNDNKFYHDLFLRNALARFLHDHTDWKLSIKNDRNADAIISNGDQRIYIEMERKDDFVEIENKIKKHYFDKGLYRVLFVMATRYSTETEQSHLNKLFDILSKLKYPPGKILGTCYTQYIDNGKFYNFRHEEVLV